MYRIVWSQNDMCGHGEYVMTLDLAQAWVTELTKMYPDMRHWIEEEPV